MPQVITNPAVPLIMPRVRAYCRVFPGTGGWPTSQDDWQFVPWLEPLFCRDCVAPEMPQARFRYNFGYQKREHTAFFGWELPQSVAGYYTQILIQQAGFAPVPVWHGTMQDDLVRPESDLRLEGSQSLTALGLARLLELQPIDVAYAEQDGAVVKISRLAKFNDRSHWGLTLIGNRSKNKFAGTYVYSGRSDKEVWSNLDIVELLVNRYPPKGVKLVLSGQFAALASIKDSHDPKKWPNLKAALDALINRHKGLGYFVRASGFGAWFIHVYSLSEVAVSSGGYTLPPNAWPTVLTLPTAFPWTHLLDPIDLRFTQMNQFDTVLVESQELLHALGTFGYHPRGKWKNPQGNVVDLDGDGTQIEGFTPELATEYNTIPAANASLADKARADDRFVDVYRKHLIGNDRTDPSRFDWQVGDGLGGDKHNIAYTAKDDGTVDPDAASPYWNAEKQLLRESPLQVGVQYDKAPVNGKVPSKNPPHTEPEFIPLLAITRDPLYLKPANKPDDPDHVFCLMDRLDVLTPPATPISARAIDKGMGIHFHCSPNHLLAKNHWPVPPLQDVATPTARVPEFDYRDTLITAAVAVDQRLHVLLKNVAFPPHHTERKHTVRVPGIHYWRATTKTIIGVDEKGQLKRIHDQNLVLRDDSPRLKALGAFLRFFLSVHRQAVEIPIKSLGLFAELGTLLLGIQGAVLSQPVNTIITSRTMTFPPDGRPESEAQLRTVLQTGLWSLEEAVGIFG